MAATKKSAKRSATKKGTSAKGRKKSAAKGRKKSAAKPSSKRASSTKAKARKGLKAARAGLGSMLQAGGKTWKTLKTTTARVVEDVKDTLADARRPAKRSRRG